MSVTVKRHVYSNGLNVEYIYSGSGNIPKQELNCTPDQSICVTIKGDFDKLEDGCFSNPNLRSVVLDGGSYKHIGSGCFKSRLLSCVALPETLESIGHDNFNGKLSSIFIPGFIKNLPADNFRECDDLFSIEVSADNEAYCSLDGILYTKDLTAVVFCPNNRTQPVVLPETVKHIGEYCFYRCKSLKKILIPSSVETIGDYAFAHCEIESITVPSSVKNIGVGAFADCTVDFLTIPDSVTSIGRGCFKCASISRTLRLPKYLVSIPDFAFDGMKAAEINGSFNAVTHVGDRGFAFMNYNLTFIRHPRMSFNSLQQVGSSAFSYYNNTKVFEFYSCLKTIGFSAFSGSRYDVKIRYFSMCPIRLDSHAFRDLPAKATLVVPPGTKMIFERATPWSLFNNIEEMSIDKDGIDAEDTEVSRHNYVERLKSIVNSTFNYDGEYLRDILKELGQNFINVESDMEYEQACSLLRYNRLFTPAIIPGLDLLLVKTWTQKYRLRYLNELLAAGIPVSELFMQDLNDHSLSTDTAPLLLSVAIENK